ncbi:MFS transporter [Bacillus pumilus]|uniref:MFS transporter n=1 Tax=Bacillus pumilus TaxID=1408 RepID=UPI00333B32CF
MKVLSNIFKNSNFPSIFSSYFFMTFGHRIGQFGILFFIWLSLKDASIIGIIFLIQAITKASSGFLFNFLSTWFKLSTLFSASFIIRIINYILLIIYFMNPNSWIFLALILAILSLVESFVEPVIYSTISKDVPQEKYSRYNSIVSLIDNISLFISPVIGSLLVLINNSVVPLLLVVICSLLIGYLLIFKKRLIFDSNNSNKSTPFKNRLKILVVNKTILYLLLTFMVFNLFMFPLLNIIFPAFIIKENNLGIGYIAYYEILFSAGLIIASSLQLFLNSNLFRAKLMMVISFILGGVGLIWIGTIPWIIIAGFGSFIIGVCLSLLRVNNTTFMQQYIDKDIQKDFFAIRSSLLLSVAPISSAVVAFSIESSNSKFIMIIGGIVLLLLSISLYIVLIINNEKEKKA